MAKKRKYSKSAGKDVEREMDRYKKARPGADAAAKAARVKSRKQAIAIGLSKARAKARRCRPRSGCKQEPHPGIKKWYFLAAELPKGKVVPSGNKTIRIAIVEDDLASRKMLVATLQAEPGYAVVAEFGEGKAAVDAIPALAPDVVLVDLGLPDISGIDVIRQLKAIDPECNRPWSSRLSATRRPSRPLWKLAPTAIC
ncbi:MAG: response regulator [Pseudolabrys sp.]